MIFPTKSIVSKVKWLSYPVFILLSHFDTVNGEFTTTTTPSNVCGFDDRITFGLGVSYACVSIILLFCVAYWSFKSIPGL